MTDLFYGDEVDLRDEIGREEREEKAKKVCNTACNIRYACLEWALVNNQDLGVQGGMSPGERREFKVYLRKQGFREIPHGAELRLNVNVYEGHDGTRPVSNGNRHGRSVERQSSVEVPADKAAASTAKVRRKSDAQRRVPRNK